MSHWGGGRYLDSDGGPSAGIYGVLGSGIEKVVFVVWRRKNIILR